MNAFVTLRWMTRIANGFAVFALIALGLGAAFAVQGQAISDNSIFYSLAVTTIAALIILFMWLVIHRTAAQLDDLRQKEEQIERAAAARTRFFAAASHDLRQPLHAISLYLSILEDRIESREDRDLFTAVSNSCDAMGALLDSLLDISRLDAGVIEPQLCPVAILDIFDELAAKFAPRAAAKSLDLRVVPNSSWVLTDPSLLSRILGNLLSNAIRFTQRGKVLLGARRRGAGLVVELWDSGPGIPKEKREKIFEAFYQIEMPGQGGRAGLGLGLTIIDKLAALLGYRVDLRSWPGKGSVFSLELPLTEAPGMQDDAGDGALPAPAVQPSGR